MARTNLKLSLLRFSVSRPGVIIGIVSLAVVCSAWFIPRVQLKLDASSLVPNGNPELLNGAKAADLFSLRDVVVVGVVNKNSCIYNPGTLSRVIRLSETLAQTEGVVSKSVTSLATMPTFSADGDRIETRPLLPEQETLSVEAIQRIRSQVESMSLDDGILAAREGSAAAISHSEISAGATPRKATMSTAASTMITAGIKRSRASAADCPRMACASAVPLM